MSFNQSVPKTNVGAHGFDFAIATTQESINATMYQYLLSIDQPEVTYCVCMDDNGVNTGMDLPALLALTNGVDPFDIENGATATTTPELLTLQDVGFVAAFRAQIGFDPELTYPNTLDLKAADISKVLFNLPCQSFIITELKYLPRGKLLWSKYAQGQPEGDEAPKPWIFSCNVDLRMHTTDKYDPATIESLDPKAKQAVEVQVRNHGPDAFGVQQLLVDLTTPALMSSPSATIVGAGSESQDLLDKYFMKMYFEGLRKSNSGASPLLSYSLVARSSLNLPPSTLQLGAMQLAAQPLLDGAGEPIQNPSEDQRRLATLNYQCVATGHGLPSAPARFRWNWISNMQELKDRDGAVAISRKAMAAYLRAFLEPYVRRCCFQPTTKVTLKDAGFGGVTYQGNMIPGQQPSVSTPNDGNTLVKFEYGASSYDQAGLNGNSGKLKIETYYVLTAAFDAGGISVHQEQYAYLSVSSVSTTRSGNVVSRQKTDRYNVSVDQQGQLTANAQWGAETRGKDKIADADSFINFFTGINQLIAWASTLVQSRMGTGLNAIPVGLVQDFVFPGGKVFQFANPGFTQTGDLAAFLRYAETA